MNAQETLQIISALKASGASYFKSQDFEIRMSSEPMVFEHKPAEPTAPLEPAPAPVEENKEATEKLKNLIETMRMSPEALLDVVMPAGAGG